MENTLDVQLTQNVRLSKSLQMCCQQDNFMVVNQKVVKVCQHWQPDSSLPCDLTLFGKVVHLTTLTTIRCHQDNLWQPQLSKAVKVRTLTTPTFLQVPSIRQPNGTYCCQCDNFLKTLWQPFVLSVQVRHKMRKGKRRPCRFGLATGFHHNRRKNRARKKVKQWTLFFTVWVFTGF